LNIYYDYLKNIFIIIILILLICSLLLLNLSNENKTKSLNSELDNYNFNYTWIDNLSYSNYNKSVYNLTEQEFYLFISSKYKYKSKVYDCKYWSKFYYDIFKNFNYNVKYVLFENQHIFIVAFNNEKYIVIDGLNIRTTYLI